METTILFAFIHQDFIKYFKILTIITHEKESIENMTDNIFEETGLAVRVTTIWRAA